MSYRFIDEYRFIDVLICIALSIFVYRPKTIINCNCHLIIMSLSSSPLDLVSLESLSVSHSLFPFCFFITISRSLSISSTLGLTAPLVSGLQFIINHFVLLGGWWEWEVQNGPLFVLILLVLSVGWNELPVLFISWRLWSW